jgi:uncharacterized protein (TIGR00730 family)
MSVSIRRICVFTGSRPGGKPEYLAGARALGGELAARGIGLVYGGASVGLMGALADTMLEAGGDVIGVIPSWLTDREIGHTRLRDLRVVGSMHERKAAMAELADAFIAMPGGFGTFDELFEIVTWAQIGLHNKPVGLLDVAGFFGPVNRLFDHVIAEGFAAKEHAGLVLTRASPGELVDALLAFTPPPLGPKWADIRGRS